MLDINMVIVDICLVMQFLSKVSQKARRVPENGQLGAGGWGGNLDDVPPRYENEGHEA